MHCCLGIWFKKKWTQLFNTCSYQHWQGLPTEPQLPISARVCLGHYGGRWKHLATPPPHRRSVCFPGEADFPSAALCYVLIPKPQDKTTVAFSCIWFFFLLPNLSNLEQQKFILSYFWIAWVQNHGGCGAMLPPATSGKILFLSLPAYGGSGNLLAHGNVILTSVSVVPLPPHSLWVCHPACSLS